MRKDEIVRRHRAEMDELRKQLPKKTYIVRLQNDEEIEIQAHGFNWADHYESSIKPIKVTFWVHPYDNIAFFNNPVFVKEQ